MAVAKQSSLAAGRGDPVGEVLIRIQDGPILTGRWHWLTYNFTPNTLGFRLVGIPTAMALVAVDEVAPGFTEEQISRLERMGGRERDQGDYQHILSWYAELLVLRQLAVHDWPTRATFELEPTAGDSKFNPEVLVRLDGIGGLGVEVKAPALLAHNKQRDSNPFQMNARAVFGQELPGNVTLPRDNPVKDFLIHADKKFAGFRAADENFRSILVIVWDDYVNEPLAALRAPGSGLLTPNSFHKSEGGEPVTYENIDSVLLVRHQHQLVEGLANRPLIDGRQHLLDYGRHHEFPVHALVFNPHGRQVPQAFLDALHAHPLETLQGAEYSPSELVMWTPVAGSSDHRST